MRPLGPYVMLLSKMHEMDDFERSNVFFYESGPVANGVRDPEGSGTSRLNYVSDDNMCPTEKFILFSTMLPKLLSLHAVVHPLMGKKKMLKGWHYFRAFIYHLLRPLEQETKSS